MAIEFKLPELGENIETADIVNVTVSEGDVINVDDIVLEIETDKATVEVPSDVSGKITKVHIKAGETAKVGQVILTLEKSGESKSEDAPKKEETKTSEKNTEAKKDETPKKEKVKENKTESPQKEITGSYEFKLPELGENIESADVTAILVKVGDDINEDDPVLEIETDKATVEVPIDRSGKVTEVKIKEGQKAKVGETVLVLETSGSAIKKSPEPEKKVEEKKEEKVEKKSEERSESSKAVEIPADSTHSARQFKKEISGKIAPASPSIRRFAREIGIDIHQVRGSGPGGRISIEDVKSFAKNLNENISKGGGAIGISSETLPDFSKWGEIEREPMNNIRKKTAEHLSYAWATIPHVTQFDKADITDLEKFRKQFSKQVENAGGKLTVTAILLKIVAEALKQFPQFNCSIDMEKKEIIYKKYFNIGIAVDTERGLLVPVIKDVDKKSITKLSIELGEIAGKARDKKIALEDMQGGNFSISNLGGIGGTYFTPIVNSPEVAILGVSRGSYEPVYKDGEFVPRQMLPLSLSYDHRIIDGADAIRFLRWIVESLENPFKILL
ncbi:MAG: dihydrolipoyllysine-residue acetyltransferase [Melioribacteraceae bacterium]|nr:MAG: dihydrolipoyllysine-residue acetyltransferase [Melioribacteraceae bacterium]